MNNITLGKYQLNKIIGRGSFSTVFQALDRNLGINRAIKVLSPIFTMDAEFVRAFSKEARISAQLEHPFIVPVYDFEQLEGYIFLVMKYLPEGSLKDLLDKVERLSLNHALLIIEQVSHAMTYAYKLNHFIHRDIKPSNILFDNGNARLSDFGFAKALRASDSVSNESIDKILGTVSYMAPELWKNEKQTSATDVYSLGCVFYEMLSGKQLWEGESPIEIIKQHAFGAEEILWPSNIPNTIQKFFQKALAKNPSERFKDIIEFSQAFGELREYTKIPTAFKNQASDLREASVSAAQLREENQLNKEHGLGHSENEDRNEQVRNQNIWNLGHLNFDIEINDKNPEDRYEVVIRSPVGEARDIIIFPYLQKELSDVLNSLHIDLLRLGKIRRVIYSEKETRAKEFGCKIFDSIFTGTIRSLYAASKHEAISKNRGLRLRLRIRDKVLATVPWELLYDSALGDFICLSAKTPLVRYIELPQPATKLSVKPPLRILGVIPNPINLPRLNVEKERQNVISAVNQLTNMGKVELHWLEGRTWKDLQKQLRAGPWHILHFIGHGNFDNLREEGTVAFSDEAGKAHFLHATDLGRLLSDHLFLRLVVLNSCEGAYGSENDIFSSTASQLVKLGIPAVLAMQYEITDTAAIEFTEAFYSAIADQCPVDVAVAEGRRALSISFTKSFEWSTPVLYMRSNDGCLFETPMYL